MKKYVFAAYLIVGLFACQQDTPSNNNTTTCTEPSATFKFKFDGTLVDISGSLTQNSREGAVIRKEQLQAGSGAAVLTNSIYGYSILATKNYYYSDDGEPIIEIEINSPTLTTTTYSTSNIYLVQTYYPQQGVFCGPPNCSSILSGTSFTVTITKLVNGYADGTFSGVLSQGNTATRYQITEGEFHNVKVLQ